jgi:hypothetical protein
LALEETLQEHEERVETLLKSANKYVGVLKSWKKACQVGHIGNLQKMSGQAEELSRMLPESTGEVKGSWDFDLAAYLESSAWREELSEVAAQKYSLRTLEDGNNLIASPITVRAQAARGTLQLGKVNWPNIRPRIVAEELKRLRDKTANANSQEFLESLFAAAQYLSPTGDIKAKFRDIYKLFCLTPGYKKDNAPAAFGQQIYALHRSGVTNTRAGHTFEFEFITGSAKDSDVFPVMTEDGRLVRYYNIWFKVV